MCSSSAYFPSQCVTVSAALTSTKQCLKWRTGFASDNILLSRLRWCERFWEVGRYNRRCDVDSRDGVMMTNDDGGDVATADWQ